MCVRLDAGLAAGRSRRLDRVPQMNLAIGQDVGPQPTLVDQTGDHAWPGQSLQVHAWLAKALAERAHGPDRELPSDQGAEGDAPRDDVAPGLGSGEVRAAREGHAIEGLRLNEGQVVSAQPVRPWCEGAGLGRVPITHQPSSGERGRGDQRLHGPRLDLADVDANNFSYRAAAIPGGLSEGLEGDEQQGLSKAHLIDRLAHEDGSGGTRDDGRRSAKEQDSHRLIGHIRRVNDSNSVTGPTELLRIGDRHKSAIEAGEPQAQHGEPIIFGLGRYGQLV